MQEWFFPLRSEGVLPFVFVTQHFHSTFVETDINPELWGLHNLTREVTPLFPGRLIPFQFGAPGGSEGSQLESEDILYSNVCRGISPPPPLSTGTEVTLCEPREITEQRRTVLEKKGFYCQSLLWLKEETEDFVETAEKPPRGWMFVCHISLCVPPNRWKNKIT